MKLFKLSHFFTSALFKKIKLLKKIKTLNTVIYSKQTQ